jgi:hypothetical protein
MQKIIFFSLACHKEIEVLFHKFWHYAPYLLLFLEGSINLEIKKTVKAFTDYFLFQLPSSKNEWLKFGNEFGEKW